MLLDLRGISKRFGPTHALTGVDFQLRHGELHALCGENGAGKSTLMKIIDGILVPDEGELYLNGEKVKISSPAQAVSLGIGLVHQEISLCANATVAENIFMAELNSAKSMWMNFDDLNARAKTVLQLLGKEIPPDQLVENLTISNQQLVEIAKALALDCKLLILDEPTAALTEVESKALFRVLHGLTEKKGIGIVLISHRMVDIFEHCSHVTVLRDGRHVHTGLIKEMLPDDLIRKMVGRELGSYYPAKNAAKTVNPVFEVKNLCEVGKEQSVSFAIRQGEVLGIAGLMGAGRTELVTCICGLRTKASGEMWLHGEKIEADSYAEALKKGIGYLSEDRKSEGVFLELPIAQNISSMALHRVQTFWKLIDSSREHQLAVQLGSKLKLKSESVTVNAENLSGGNQQKVAIAKLLATSPTVLFMDEPTRGVDVGAKAEIHQILRDLANSGVGIVVISSELPEIIGLCDRTLVICNGEIAGELSGNEMTEESILRLASGLK